jgi:hypothetical protein
MNNGDPTAFRIGGQVYQRIRYEMSKMIGEQINSFATIAV